MRAHELVNAVKIWPDRFAVQYRSGVIDRFWLHGIGNRPRGHIQLTREQAILGDDIPVTIVAETGYRLVAIPHKRFRSGTVIDRCLAVQRFVNEIAATGYDGRLPAQLLAGSLPDATNLDRLVIRPGRIALSCHDRPWPAQVISHFFDCRCLPSFRRLDDAARNHRVLAKLARKLVNSDKKVSSFLIYRLLWRKYRPLLFPYASYVALLRHVGVSGSLYDPHPETGVKAMAAAALGLTYLTDGNDKFDSALEAGFATMTGLKHGLIGAGVADWAVLDFNRLGFDSAEVMRCRGRCRRLLLYVPPGADVPEGRQTVEFVFRPVPNDVLHRFVVI